MGIESCDWQDHKDIQRWMADWREEVAHKSFDFRGQDDPADELRHRLARGDFRGRNKLSVEAFLRAFDAKVHRISEHGKADREERAVVAAERSAKWAGLAIAIALTSLAVSAWPHVKDLLN